MPVLHANWKPSGHSEADVWLEIKMCSLISVSFFATEHKINIMMESWLYGEVKEIKTDSNHLGGKSDEIVMTHA